MLKTNITIFSCIPDFSLHFCLCRLPQLHVSRIGKMIYSTPNFTLAAILEMLEPNMTWGEGRSEKKEKKDANEKSKGGNLVLYKIAGA